MDKKKESQAVYDIKYHVIWMTKNRYNVFHDSIVIRVLNLIRQECQARELLFLQGSGGKDHIQFVFSCPPSLAPSNILQHLKRRSSRLLQDEYPELKKKYMGQELWEKGYFCSTLGTVTEKTIRSFIANQIIEEKNNIFKID